MKNRILNYMKQFHMVEPNNRVVVGLSGGADSVFLLWILKAIASDEGFFLEALHFHHGLRAASNQEEVFVQDLCQKWDIPCTVAHLDVKGYALQHKVGTEEAARILRYEAFERESQKVPGTKIALAHHQNDQAETVLYQMVRGSDVRGLQGILPVRDSYIRPLLCVTRKEIEEYLQALKISYVTDESNQDDSFKRNYIRNQIIPNLETNINERAVEHIASSAESMGEMMDFVDQMMATYIEEFVTVKEYQVVAPKDSLQKLHPFLQKRLIYEMMCLAAGQKKDISRVHVQSVMGLLQGQSGKTIDLMYGMKCMADQQFLIIKKGLDDIDCAGKNQDSSTKEGDFSSDFMIRIFSYDENMIIPEDRYTKWLDYDKMGKQLVYRTRQEKDFLFVGDQCKKKLKSFFVDEKIPLSCRDQVPLVANAETGEIYWVVGYRINHNYKITKDTKNVIEIKYQRVDESGGKHGRQN